jgi:hypothetical protein
MEMHQVRYFLALCATLNFTRAVESCNVSTDYLQLTCVPEIGEAHLTTLKQCVD